MISGAQNRTLLLWNMSTYQCETMFKGVGCYDINSLYQVDNNRIIVGGEKSFSIVNIDKCVIEKTIEDKKFEFVYCFLKLRDNTIILCGCCNGIFCFYDMRI